jgi:hypothetical protein
VVAVMGGRCQDASTMQEIVGGTGFCCILGARASFGAGGSGINNAVIITVFFMVYYLRHF